MNVILPKCSIRPFQITDAPSVAFHANNIHIAQNLRDFFPNPYLLKDAEVFIRHSASSVQNLIRAIVVEDVVVGTIGIFPQGDVYRKTAEIGYWLGESYWNRGITSEAVTAIVEYAFNSYPLVRIYAGVFERNTASMKVLEKCGFTCEAIHQKAIVKNEIIMNEHIYTKLLF